MKYPWESEVDMWRSGSIIASLSVVSISLLLVAAGCSEEEKECPICPDPGIPSPTMENLWPNEDGSSWTYEWTMREWNSDEWTIYEDPGDVPGAPTLDFVEGLLGGHPIGAEADTSLGIFRLEFDGTCTGDSGATGQCLLETVFEESSGVLMVLSPGESFLDRLLMARPELAGMPAAAAGSGPERSPGADAQIIGPSPLYLHGGIWEKGDGYIGTYSDVDTFLAWKFLEEDVSTGHEFTFQIAKSFADDIFMHCRILSRSALDTKYGDYENAVRCLYMVDYGLGSIETLEGTRYYRLYDYGTITYVPGTGPVHGYERLIIDASDPGGPGMGDGELELIGAGRD
jgi:hypothetical protein